MLEFPFPEEYLKAFQNEFEDQLQALESNILLLESEKSENSVQNIFRIAHTIKGSAASIGQESIASLTHHMETIFDGVRKGNISVTRSLIDVLFECLDTLKLLKKEVGIQQASQVDVKNVEHKLEKILNKEESELPPVVNEKEAYVAPPMEESSGKYVLDRLKKTHSVRVSVDVLDNLINLVGELITEKTRLLQLAEDLESHTEGSIWGSLILESGHRLSKLSNELEEEIMKARLIPVASIFNKFPRMVRELAAQFNKEIDFKVEGMETQLDRSVIEEISDPLIHLIRNGVDHGVESREERRQQNKLSLAKIHLSASREENHVVIRLSDDGRGIDTLKVGERALKQGLISKDELAVLTKEEIVDLIFLPGFSTAETITDISGRGVGMDIVKTHLQKMGGTLKINTTVGEGTTFIIRIPLTLAIVQTLYVSYRQKVFGIPLNTIKAILKVPEENLKTLNGRKVCTLRGEVVPVVSLAELFHQPFPESQGMVKMVVVSQEEEKIAILVDDFIGKQEAVIKTIGSYMGDLPGIAGATVLPDGTVGLMLDVASFIRLVELDRRHERLAS